jgi:GTP cyclohydrolase I
MIKNEEFQDEIGDNHVSLSAKKSVRDDAFDLSDDEKKNDVDYFKYPGMDLTDDSLKGNRVKKCL